MRPPVLMMTVPMVGLSLPASRSRGSGSMELGIPSVTLAQHGKRELASPAEAPGAAAPVQVCA